MKKDSEVTINSGKKEIVLTEKDVTFYFAGTELGYVSHTVDDTIYILPIPKKVSDKLYDFWNIVTVDHPVVNKFWEEIRKIPVPEEVKKIREGNEENKNLV